MITMKEHAVLKKNWNEFSELSVTAACISIPMASSYMPCSERGLNCGHLLLQLFQNSAISYSQFLLGGWEKIHGCILELLDKLLTRDYLSRSMKTCQRLRTDTCSRSTLGFVKSNSSQLLQRQMPSAKYYILTGFSYTHSSWTSFSGRTSLCMIQDSILVGFRACWYCNTLPGK